MTGSTRAEDMAAGTADEALGDVRATVDRLVALSQHGLTAMYEAEKESFPQTARGVTPRAPLQLEGSSVRYTAIAALGLSRATVDAQESVLSGVRADSLVPGIRRTALSGDDPGAIALAAWASAEVETSLSSIATSRDLTEVIDRMIRTSDSDEAIPTVDHSWAITALVAAALRADSDEGWAAAIGHDSAFLLASADRAADRLMDSQGQQGLFPHHLPPASLHRFRSHVGCFADQVYPVQALSRLAAATGSARAIEAATRCAERICALQGEAGQWWWHYDSRTGQVVEGYPVYSVHQHAMAPMALFELCEAGGPDLSRNISSGLAWILDPAETRERLVCDELGVVWRKVGRREPRKLVRTIRSVTTSLRPAWRLGLLDRLFPPGDVDRECRPYELGWLLYAWLGAGTVARTPPKAAQTEPVAP